MNLPDIGEVVTPVDDPCQFNPAWRSIVAGYLFSLGRWSPEDLKSISMTGCVTVTQNVTADVTQVDGPKAKKNKDKNGVKPKKSKKKISETTTINRPIYPFRDCPEYRSFVLDKWIVAMLSMFNDTADGLPLSDANVPLRLASRWYSEMDTEAAMKKRLEPLLLTEIGMDVITMDLIGLPSAQPAVEAYEKLYFNCRDDNFSLNPSMQLIERFACPYGPLKPFLRKWEDLDADGFCVQDGRPVAKDSDIWRAIAATMGYEALMYLWRWERKAHGLKDRSLSRMIEMSWQAAVSRLLSDMYTGNIAHEDAARVLASYTAQAKYISDEKRGGGNGGANDTMTALMSLLYLAAPKMVQFDEADDSARNDEIQSRIASQLAINKQSIEDHGKNVEAEIIDAQISDAVEQ